MMVLCVCLLNCNGSVVNSCICDQSNELAWWFKVAKPFCALYVLGRWVLGIVLVNFGQTFSFGVLNLIIPYSYEVLVVMNCLVLRTLWVASFGYFRVWSEENLCNFRPSESISPKREYQSLNTSKPLAWMRSHAQHAQASSRPRLGEPLSPKREYWSLNPNTSRLGERRETKLKNETLQLSLRRDGLAWAKIAEVLLWSHTKIAKRCHS